MPSGEYFIEIGDAVSFVNSLNKDSVFRVCELIENYIALTRVLENIPRQFRYSCGYFDLFC